MRLLKVGIVIASILAATAASATEGKGSKGESGSSGGGGGGSGGGGGGADQFGSGRDFGLQPDVLTGETPRHKPWEVGGEFATHRLIRTDDLAGGAPVPGSPDPGAANNKFMNEYYLYARYDITDRDRVGIRAYMYQRFLADQGETGFRFDDMVFTYTRLIPLPEKFRLQLSFWLTAPTSYDSQLSGLVTAPRFVAEIDRWFGNLNLDFRTYDEFYFQRYESYAGSGGASPNPVDRIAAVFDAEYHMPFFPVLSAGLSLYTAWTWYYNITGAGPADGIPQGVVQDSQFASQPIQQTYGGEVYVRYEMPPLAGVKSDLTVAYANGDPTIGYTSVLHDGVGHAYLGYRQTSEVYASLGVRY